MNGTASSRCGAARASVRRIWSGVRPRLGRERFFQRKQRFRAPAQAPYGDNGHPAVTGLGTCLGGEPRFANAGLAKNQDGMPFAGFGYPGDVLAKHIKLKPAVNQRFLRALAACLAPYAAAIIP